MTQIMLAHAPEAEAQAALVARRLGERGYQVAQAVNGYFAPGPLGRRKIAADIENAACVVVLWSRGAAEAPALHAAALKARALGKLAFARLDAAAAPAGLGVAKAADLSAWNGNAAARPWRDLANRVGKLAAPAPARSQPRAAPAPSRAAASAPASASAAEAPAKKGGAGGLIVVLALLALIGAGAAGAYFYLL